MSTTSTPAYDCQEALKRLDDYVDRELIADEMRLVREHIQICADCAGEFAYEEEMLDALKSKLRRIAVPAELGARVSALLSAERRRGS